MPRPGLRGLTPLPHLFACAFIANAASFVLPISNPGQPRASTASACRRSRYGCGGFALPSIASHRRDLRRAAPGPQRADARRNTCETAVPRQQLEPRAAAGRRSRAWQRRSRVVLIAASALDRPLGTADRSSAAPSSRRWCLVLRRAIAAAAADGRSPGRAAAGRPASSSWWRRLIRDRSDQSNSQCAAAARPSAQSAASGRRGQRRIVTALGDNIANNLPAGLVAGAVASSDHLPRAVTDALLIGVDLGPNLSVTGSLATILWLVALRREAIEVSAWRFLEVGWLVMFPALILALAALSISTACDNKALRRHQSVI